MRILTSHFQFRVNFSPETNLFPQFAPYRIQIYGFIAVCIPSQKESCFCWLLVAILQTISLVAYHVYGHFFMKYSLGGLKCHDWYDYNMGCLYHFQSGCPKIL